jgi:hypothetical protein
VNKKQQELIEAFRGATKENRAALDWLLREALDDSPVSHWWFLEAASGYDVGEQGQIIADLLVQFFGQKKRINVSVDPLTYAAWQRLPRGKRSHALIWPILDSE